MPISKEKMKLYPGGSIRSKEWLAIRERILKRAGNKCERCQAPNRTVILRAGDVYVLPERGETFCAQSGEFLGRTRGSEMPAGRFVAVVLTIAHLDGQLVDHSDENLQALCQQCHNRLDMRQRQVAAARTRRAKRGQLSML